jgi:hypothetical protein
MVEGTKNPGLSLMETLVPFIKASPSWSNYLPKAPPPITITEELEFQHINVKGTQIFRPEEYYYLFYFLVY